MAILEQSALQLQSTHTQQRPAALGNSFYVQFLLNSLQCLFAQRFVFALSPGHTPGRTRGSAPLYLTGCHRAARVSVGRRHQGVLGNWHALISKLRPNSQGCLQGTASSGTGGGGAVTSVRPTTSLHRSLTWRKIHLPTPIGLQT